MLVPISSSSSSVSKQTFPKFQLTFYTSRRQRGSFEKANDSLQDSPAKACLSSNFHVDQYAWKVSFFFLKVIVFPLPRVTKSTIPTSHKLVERSAFLFFAFLLLKNCIINTSQSIGRECRELLCTPTREGQSLSCPTR